MSQFKEQFTFVVDFSSQTCSFLKLLCFRHIVKVLHQQVRKPSAGGSDPLEDLSLEDYFQRFVMEHQDSMSETELAQKLGVSRKCLWERRQRLGIPRNRVGTAASQRRKSASRAK